MEMMSERERFENQSLPHDIIFSPAILALQSLIERIQKPDVTEG